MFMSFDNFSFFIFRTFCVSHNPWTINYIANLFPPSVILKMLFIINTQIPET